MSVLEGEEDDVETGNRDEMRMKTLKPWEWGGLECKAHLDGSSLRLWPGSGQQREKHMFGKCRKYIVSSIVRQIESPLAGRLHGVVWGRGSLFVTEEKDLENYDCIR